MGFFNWRRPKNRSGEQGERSPGGSKLIHYPKETPKPNLGFADQCFSEEREKIYKEFFGECKSVFHEIVPVVPHVDVYQYEPGHAGRNFYTLVTGGMSDVPMALEAGVDRKYRRAEAVLYVEEPAEIHCRLLRFIAHFPHDYRSWLGSGHTIPNGQPPASLFGDSKLTTVLLLPSLLQPDSRLGERLVCAGDPVNLLWVVPITDAECDLKLKQGLSALLNVFDRHQHPSLLNPRRESYV